MSFSAQFFCCCSKSLHSIAKWATGKRKHGKRFSTVYPRSAECKAKATPTLMRHHRDFFHHIWFPSRLESRREHFYIPFITGLILKLQKQNFSLGLENIENDDVCVERQRERIFGSDKTLPGLAGWLATCFNDCFAHVWKKLSQTLEVNDSIYLHTHTARSVFTPKKHTENAAPTSTHKIITKHHFSCATRNMPKPKLKKMLMRWPLETTL